MKVIAAVVQGLHQIHRFRSSDQGPFALVRKSAHRPENQVKFSLVQIRNAYSDITHL